MKICRFLPPSSQQSANRPESIAPIFGRIEGDQVRELTAAPWSSPSNEIVRGTATHALADVKLVAPVAPSKIVCVGRNYAAHAAELGNEIPKEPMIFLKPPSSIVGPGEAIVLPTYSQRVEHEGELAIVIGKRCSHLGDNDNPLSYVFGYTCANDVTARDLQKADVQFTRAKGFDTFCPIGPHIETQLDPANVIVETRVNSDLRQSGSTSLMIYPCAFLVRWISRMMTLLPGDVISTGTPSGVGPLVGKDTVEVSVTGIGVLRNPVHVAQA
jgi:2-keto-4-pentenoate hydratase/2-oxohepta-3-ene-1,7-dioic acid hydratase in catechol pathway